MNRRFKIPDLRPGMGCLSQTAATKRSLRTFVPFVSFCSISENCKTNPTPDPKLETRNRIDYYETNPFWAIRRPNAEIRTRQGASEMVQLSIFTTVLPNEPNSKPEWSD